MRVDVLSSLTSALREQRLLSHYQHALMTAALQSYTPRYLQIVDSFLQSEKSYQLAVRSDIRTSAASTHSASSYGPPPPPTSLCNPSTHRGTANPSAIPLSSFLSSSASFQPFSPSSTLLHLLSSALLHTLEEMWLACFMSIPTSVAKRLSREERATRSLLQPSLVYGEISFQALAAIVWSVRRDSGGIFVDLGSGSGRGVIGALLLHDWDVVRGVEMLDGLWQASVAVKEKVERERRAGVIGGVGGVAGAEAGGLVGGRRTKLIIDKGSFLEVDWTDADVVLANSTCFDQTMMDSIAKRGQKLKDGSHSHNNNETPTRRHATQRDTHSVHSVGSC
jgi:Histone methylation protein DOT1